MKDAGHIGKIFSVYNCTAKLYRSGSFYNIIIAYFFFYVFSITFYTIICVSVVIYVINDFEDKGLKKGCN